MDHRPASLRPSKLLMKIMGAIVFLGVLAALQPVPSHGALPSLGSNPFLYWTVARDSPASHARHDYTLPAPHAAHAKRGETYDYNEVRGCKLLNLMSTPKALLHEDFQAQWHEYSDIENHGWTRTTEPINLDEKTSAKSVLKDLGLEQGLDGPDWIKVKWDHTKETALEGVTYPATNAFYHFILNTEAGIMIIANAESPAKVDPHITPEPKLNRLSDITFLEYQHLASNPSNLKHIIHLNIISSDIEETLSQITKGDLEDTLKPYPGETLEVPEDDVSNDAKAMVGSSNGVGVGWLLVQHKVVMGDTRRVKEVRYWDSKDGESSGLPGLDGIPNVMFSF